MPGCLDKKSKFGRNEFLRLGSRNILKFPGGSGPECMGRKEYGEKEEY